MDTVYRGGEDRNISQKIKDLWCGDATMVDDTYSSNRKLKSIAIDILTLFHENHPNKDELMLCRYLTNCDIDIARSKNNCDSSYIDKYHKRTYQITHVPLKTMTSGDIVRPLYGVNLSDVAKHAGNNSIREEVLASFYNMNFIIYNDLYDGDFNEFYKKVTFNHMKDMPVKGGFYIPNIKQDIKHQRGVRTSTTLNLVPDDQIRRSLQNLFMMRSRDSKDFIKIIPASNFMKALDKAKFIDSLFCKKQEFKGLKSL